MLPNTYTAESISRAFGIFKVIGKVTDMTQGPRLTMAHLELESNTKVGMIKRLEGELAYKLKVPAVSITVQPEFGRIRLEIPNSASVPFRLSTMLRPEGSYPTPHIPIGVSCDGHIWSALEDLPHLLVAGATGSGKSVFLNSIIITSILTMDPENLQLALIDPLAVEFAPYEESAHLACKNAYEPWDIAWTLDYITALMEGRYEAFQKHSVKDIRAFRALEVADCPYIMVIIDELATVFDMSPAAEDKVINLAQLGRKAGIHLIVGTQRPSADVISGRVKANFTARLAFQTASAVNSRIILDQGGAEKLLGKGDALYIRPGYGLTRIQCPLVTAEEVGWVMDMR